MEIKPTTWRHMRMDVRGAIQNGQGWKAVSAPDGGKLTKREAVAWLLDRLAEGKLFLPLGDCDRFDYKHGYCSGHADRRSYAERGATPSVPPTTGRGDDGK